MKTSSPSGHVQKAAQSVEGEGCIADNPLSQSAYLLKLCATGLLTKEFMRSKAIHEPSYAVFLMIVQNWLTDNKGTTVQDICRRLNSHHPAREWENTLKKVHLLFGKHMIEIIGKSSGGRANLYAPVSEAMRELVEFTTAA